MVQVNLWAGLRRFTDGKDTVEIKARNVGEILNALENKYPELREIFIFIFQNSGFKEVKINEQVDFEKLYNLRKVQ